MEYNREYWEPRIATKPNRFRKLNESNDYVELINEPEAISQAGTAFTAARMNNIEAGIKGVVAEVNEIQGVLDLTDEVPTFAGNADTATLATQALEIKPLGNSITLPATSTSVTKIIKIATVDWSYAGSINISCSGNYIDDGIKVHINGGASYNGIRVIYGKNNVTYGIKKIIVTRVIETWDSNRYIYAEVVTYPNSDSTTSLGVVETNHGTFTPSMTEVSSVEGTVVDSLSLDYERGDISSYQHEFTKDIIGNLTGNAGTATKLATARKINGVLFDGSTDITVADSTKAPINNPAFTGTPTINGGTVWHSGNDPFPNRAQGRNSVMLSDSRNQGSKAANSYLMGIHFEFVENKDIGQPDSTQYSGVLTLQPWVDGSAGGPSQLAFTQSGNIYKRYSADRTNWGGWDLIWTSGNDGSGSGLDADLLDGQHGSYYAPLASPALTGSPTAPTPATETNNTQIATTAFVKNQNYEPNRGTGINSIALGINSKASGGLSIALGIDAESSGDSSTALGRLSEASGDYSTALGASSEASGEFSTALGRAVASGNCSIALGVWSTASGDYSLALGYNAAATRDYQITIGTKFVYLRFASTDTEATVYAALSPWVNPTTGYSQGAMGSFGTNAITRILRDSSTGIYLYGNDNSLVKTINSNSSNPIGSDLAICTVKF